MAFFAPLFLIHYGLCVFMTGLIWMVQLVHYPSFSYVEEKVFGAFASFHSRAISFIVLPAMVAELASGAYLFYQGRSVILGINLACLVLIWLSTFFLSVPLHSKLAKGKDSKSIGRLVATNWPRTVLWSARSLFLFPLALKALGEIL